jgi:hypothetical protein
VSAKNQISGIILPLLFTSPMNLIHVATITSALIRAPISVSAVSRS